MIVRINCDRCPDSWRPVTLHPLNGLPIKLLAALSVYSMEGAVAHVLSVDLVKHNRGGFKGPEGTGGDLDLPDSLRDKWALRNSSGLPAVEALQATRKQTMPDGRYGR